MKKLCCAIIVAVSFLGACSRTGKTPEIRVGLVNFTAGTVIISGPAGKEVPAKPGDPLADRMTVRTGEKSVCEISFDNTSIRLAENSILAMEKLYYGKGLAETTDLALRKGEIFTAAPKLIKGSSFSIKTTTAVAAVRGTQFFVTEGKTSTVSCTEGKVAVICTGASGARESIISAGEEVAASRGNVAEKRIISSERREQFASRSALAPMTKENADTFEKIRANDPETIRRIKDQLASFYALRGGASGSFAVNADAAPAAEISVPVPQSVSDTLPAEEFAAPESVFAQPAPTAAPAIQPSASAPIATAPQPKAEPAAEAPALKPKKVYAGAQAPREQQKKGSTGGQSAPPYESSLPYFLEQ